MLHIFRETEARIMRVVVGSVARAAHLSNDNAVSEGKLNENRNSCGSKGGKKACLSLIFNTNTYRKNEAYRSLRS